jgi:hypothetical protein
MTLNIYECSFNTNKGWVTAKVTKEDDGSLMLKCEGAGDLLCGDVRLRPGEVCRIGAAKLAAVLAGESPANRGVQTLL